MKCELLLLLLKSAVAISCGRASRAGRDVSVNIFAFTQTQAPVQQKLGVSSVKSEDNVQRIKLDFVLSLEQNMV